ncbi:MAG: hypothetical protein ACI9HE_002735 [Planctomycetota bacterium]|jgi:hypothetical protein
MPYSPDSPREGLVAQVRNPSLRNQHMLHRLLGVVLWIAFLLVLVGNQG